MECPLFSLNTMKKSAIFFNIIVLALLIAALFCGCAHNTGALTVGTRVNVGIDPQNCTANVSYVDGLNVLDLSRENSEWVIETDSQIGIKADKHGTIKGVRSIKRTIGPQITGYLVDLAKTHPDLAKEYVEAMKYFWKSQCKEEIK